MNPKVSINLCCYNSEKYLRETLDSIINQTYKDWELIIINDGSSDSTESIIYEYIKQGYPIIYYYQENKGLGYSRNEALKRSQGEYIAFIDHDDIWMPCKLEKQVLILKNDCDADFLYSNYFVIKGKRKILALRGQQPQGHVFERFLYHYTVAILTAMVRKKAIERLDNLFDENLNLAEEYDLFMRLLYKSKAVYQDEPLAVYRMYSGMSSIRFMEKWPDEIEYVFKKLGHLYLNFEKDYSDALKKSRLELEYVRAKIYMKQGNLRFARRQIAPYRFLNLRYFFLYVFSYMPIRLWSYASLRLSRGPF
jgi:glycosyltransferase involved in cell wall biosynthesis